MFVEVCFFLFSGDGDHRDLPVLAHSFPTRRSSDLRIAIVGVGGHNLGLAGTKPNTVHVHSALYDQIDRVTGMGMAAAQRIAGTTVQPDDCRHRRILISILSQGYGACPSIQPALRSEEHTSELQSLTRRSYAVLCLKQTNH